MPDEDENKGAPVSDVLIKSLQDQIERLQNQNTKWRGENKERRERLEALTAEHDKLKQTLETLTKERDTLKTTVEARPHELQATVDDLRGKLRDRDHRDKFKQLAKTQGVTQEKALDDLWQLSGYKAEADEIDETKLTAAITGALKDRDWLKAASASDGANGSAADAAMRDSRSGALGNRQPGPGANRGAGAGDNAIDTDQQFRAVTGHGNSFRIA